MSGEATDPAGEEKDRLRRNPTLGGKTEFLEHLLLKCVISEQGEAVRIDELRREMVGRETTPDERVVIEETLDSLARVGLLNPRDAGGFVTPTAAALHYDTLTEGWEG
jgi:hypothetical protein